MHTTTNHAVEGENVKMVRQVFLSVVLITAHDTK